MAPPALSSYLPLLLRLSLRLRIGAMLVLYPRRQHLMEFKGFIQSVTLLEVQVFSQLSVYESAEEGLYSEGADELETRGASLNLETRASKDGVKFTAALRSKTS